MLKKADKEKIKEIEHLVSEKQRIENILRKRMLFSIFVTREMKFLDVSEFDIIKVMKIKHNLKKDFKEKLKDVTQKLLSYQIEK